MSDELCVHVSAGVHVSTPFARKTAEVEDEAAVMASFLKDYRDVLVTLPGALYPTSTKHGKHSYTQQPL